MNILKARQLQRELYKQAHVPFKKSFIESIDGEFYYVNSIQISNRNAFLLSNTFLRAMCDIKNIEDLTTSIVYASETKSGGTEGMYISQMIKID